MANIPDLGTKDPVSAKMPASHASNGVAPGQTAQLLKGQGAIGGAQEANHQPTKVPHPHGKFVDRDGSRFDVKSQ
jgi:hypothetical protein